MIYQPTKNQRDSWQTPWQEMEASDQIPHPQWVVIKCPAPGKTKLIKFPPPGAGKGVKCPGGMLKIRFDWYIIDSKNGSCKHTKAIDNAQSSFLRFKVVWDAQTHDITRIVDRKSLPENLLRQQTRLMVQTVPKISTNRAAFEGIKFYTKTPSRLPT